MAFHYSRWLSLSLPTRHQLAVVFDIPKTGPTHVDTNRVVSDGYAIEAVEGQITVYRIQQYVDSHEEDEERLWDMMVAKAEGKEEQVVEVAPVFSQEKTAVEEPKVEEPKPEPGSVEESNAKPEHIKVQKVPELVKEVPKKRGRPTKKSK